MLTFLEVHAVDLVLDVGANVGQYGKGLRDLGYTGRIWSFEPVRAAFEQLEARTRRDSLWNATHSAVGSATGDVTINVSEMSVFSSIKTANEAARAFDSRAAVVERQQVPVAALDGLMAEESAENVFLKIDTQGFELEVLEGASDLCARLVGIQLEVPVENLYDDVWSFSECVGFMDHLGFVPAQSRTVNAGRKDPASAVEFDFIYRRK